MDIIMLRTTIAALLSTSSLFISVSAFGIGPACTGAIQKQPGNCVMVSDCTTNEWLFGTDSNPVCDVAGSDWKIPTTKVCCFDGPPQPADNEGPSDVKVIKI